MWWKNRTKVTRRNNHERRDFYPRTTNSGSEEIENAECAEYRVALLGVSMHVLGYSFAALCACVAASVVRSDSAHFNCTSFTACS